MAKNVGVEWINDRNVAYLNLFGIGVVILWLLVWELSISQFELLNPLFLPPPSTILLDVYRSLIVTGELRIHMWTTATRLLVGLIIGALPALCFGFMMGRNESAGLLYGPFLAALGLIPIIAGFHFFIIMFGIGELNKWVVVSAAVFYPILYCTKNGVRVSRALQHAGTSTGHGLERRQWQNGAGPWIFTGLKLGTLLGLATLLSAEMYASKTGLGIEISRLAVKFQMDRAYGGMFAAALFAYVLWGCLTVIEFALRKKTEKEAKTADKAKPTVREKV